MAWGDRDLEACREQTASWLRAVARDVRENSRVVNLGWSIAVGQLQ